MVIRDSVTLVLYSVGFLHSQWSFVEYLSTKKSEMKYFHILTKYIYLQFIWQTNITKPAGECVFAKSDLRVPLNICPSSSTCSAQRMAAEWNEPFVSVVFACQLNKIICQRFFEGRSRLTGVISGKHLYDEGSVEGALAPAAVGPAFFPQTLNPWEHVEMTGRAFGPS